jgi:hypothetical protein
MKIRSDRPYRGPMRHDVRKDFSPEQLQEIGAVCMAFNILESALDFIVARHLKVAFPAARTVRDKISGISAKIEVLRAIARDDLGLAEDIWKDTLDKIGECTGYRNAIVHTRMVDAWIEIGETIQRGSIDHVYLNKDALTGLYNFIVAVHNEFASLHYVMLACAEAAALQNRAQPKEQGELSLEDALERFHRDRQSRKALKPLPPVPELYLDLPQSGTPPKPEKGSQPPGSK